MLQGRIPADEPFASVLAGAEEGRSAFVLNHEISSASGGRLFRRILIKALQIHVSVAKIQFQTHENLQIIWIENDVKLLLLIGRLEQFAICVSESDEEVFGETLRIGYMDSF